MQAHTRRRRRSALALVGLVVVLLAGGVVASAKTGAIDAAGRYMPWSSPQSSCSATTVDVVAAPQITPVVQTIVSPLSGRSLPDGSCLQVTVQAQTPATTVETAAETASSAIPQVWVPDSSLWAARLPIWPARVVGSLATSSVVLATSPASVAKLGWRDHQVPWSTALDTSHGIIAPSITTDASSLLSLLALAKTLGPGTKTEQRIAATVLKAAITGAPDVGSALQAARDSGERNNGAAVLLTSEQAVADANRDQPGKLMAVHPAGAPIALDFPILRIGRSTDDPVLTVATGVVVQALLTPGATRTAAAADFGPPAPAMVPQSPAAAKAMAEGAKQAENFVTLIQTLAVPSRLLVLMDTSLSMNQPVRPGLTRALLAVKAAEGAGELLPGQSAIGLWSFAGRQPGGKPYQERTPIDQLNAVDAVNGKAVTHRDVINGQLQALPTHLSSGGTALYDTALAALKNARATYDPQANNAVVLFTDGSDDYAPGISLQDFQRAAKAEAQAHPQQPVLLIAIGIGPDADMTALRAMCAAAGGRAYQANSVETLKTVLFDSIAHRQVPGNAGG